MTVSVALCTYNGANYLELQLESILNQTVVPDEVVVSDDGSDDGTLELVRDYAQQYPETIRVLDEEKNLGVTKNFEHAIEACEGELIALADQDDYWHEEKLERQIEAYEQTDAELICHDSYLVSNNNVMTNHADATLWSSIRGRHNPLTATDPKRAVSELLERNFVQGATILVSSKLVDQALPIPDCANHDYYLAILAALTNGIYDMDARLLNYRQHSDQDIGVSRSPLQKLTKEISIEAEEYGRRACFWKEVLSLVQSLESDIMTVDREWLVERLSQRHSYSESRQTIRNRSTPMMERISTFGQNVMMRRYVQFGHPAMILTDLFMLLFIGTPIDSHLHS
ncbi:glycosyltransferase family 2 protein [Natrialbaceae archaeon GCM10025810]|uniref:glycosyltransferase family 2 protein n=1 Tax=Halovalidus salilacus TaxID=3075124 RepID=UPI00360B3640